MIENLKINLIDQIQCKEDWSWISERNGWSGYHIWCVDGGAAYIETGEQKYHLLKGDIFLFNLNKNHVCTHNPELPLRVTTTYFSCQTQEKESTVLRQENLLCDAMHRAASYYLKGEVQMAELWITAVIYEVFVKRETRRELPRGVEKACEWMESVFPYTPTLTELAEKTGYSKNQIIRLFKQNLGITPVQYGIQKKMEYAKGLLLYSDIPIIEIASRAGYVDAAYFTRTFRKCTGLSPAEYRKIVRKEE